MSNSHVRIVAVVFLMAGCGSRSPKPVDIYPEDMCANCRMAVSEMKCASEIITATEVFKFDDLACLAAFQERRKDLRIEASYVKDYESGRWVKIENAIRVTTGVFTPMGSGIVAFADSSKATSFLMSHPPRPSKDD